MFFTSTDRDSTIPSNICQSGTWSAGQDTIRGASNQRNIKKTRIKKKEKKEREHAERRREAINKAAVWRIHAGSQHKEGHFLGRVGIAPAASVFETALPGLILPCICTQRRYIFKAVLSGF